MSQCRAGVLILAIQPLFFSAYVGAAASRHWSVGVCSFANFAAAHQGFKRGYGSGPIGGSTEGSIDHAGESEDLFDIKSSVVQGWFNERRQKINYFAGKICLNVAIMEHSKDPSKDTASFYERARRYISIRKGVRDLEKLMRQDAKPMVYELAALMESSEVACNNDYLFDQFYDCWQRSSYLLHCDAPASIALAKKLRDRGYKFKDWQLKHCIEQYRAYETNTIINITPRRNHEEWLKRNCDRCQQVIDIMISSMESPSADRIQE